MDISEKNLLIEQFRKFADKNSFTFQIAYYTSNHEDFLVDLTRNDIEVIASNSGIDLDSFYVGFHNNDCVHPTVASEVESLVSDLKVYMSQIPGAVISEEK